MSKKFIPNADPEFSDMAFVFARTIAKDPQRFLVSQEDSDALTLAVRKFEDALQACRGGQRSTAATRAKEIARDEAEQIIRRLASLIRASRTINPIDKMNLGLRERTNKPKQLPCPQEPPRLRFVQALHKGNSPTPMHELSFTSLNYKSKPPGAVRLELFVALVPIDDPMPTQPCFESRSWYLRSFTKSPIVLVPPIARMPMRVVYWGRWADSAGNVGPFSTTVEGWIEGGQMTRLAPQLPAGPPKIEQIDVQRVKMEDQERIVWVAIGEAQMATMNPNGMNALPMEESGARRLLEGDVREEAA